MRVLLGPAGPASAAGCAATVLRSAATPHAPAPSLTVPGLAQPAPHGKQQQQTKSMSISGWAHMLHSAPHWHHTHSCTKRTLIECTINPLQSPQSFGTAHWRHRTTDTHTQTRQDEQPTPTNCTASAAHLQHLPPVHAGLAEAALRRPHSLTQQRQHRPARHGAPAALRLQAQPAAVTRHAHGQHGTARAQGAGGKRPLQAAFKEIMRSSACAMHTAALQGHVSEPN